MGKAERIHQPATIADLSKSQRRTEGVLTLKREKRRARESSNSNGAGGGVETEPGGRNERKKKA